MNFLVGVGVAGAFAVACLDWWAVRTSRASVEEVAKPLVMVLLLIGALLAVGAPASVRLLVALGLGFGLVGDVLLLPRFDRFVEGLGAFLVGHLSYAVAFLFVGVTGWVVFGLIAAVLAVGVLGRSIIAASPDKLRLPVTVYVAVIGAMVALGIGTTEPLFGVGAAVFAASDALLGHDRFVTPRGDRRMWVHVLYHLGQGLLVVGLVPL